MPHPLDLFVSRHRLGPDARAELEQMVADASSGAWSARPASPDDPETPWSVSALAAEAAGPPAIGGDTVATVASLVSEHSAAMAPARTTRASTPPGPAFSDRYLDQGPLGAGGMGEVRRVYDRYLARSVALKRLHWKLVEDERCRTRFEAESTMTAGLEHPGIVPVYDRGVLPDGSPWFTMKCVRGRTLTQAAAEGAPTEALVEAFLGVCDAMAYAHARKVVHRDLKPSNVMVGEFGEVLVMDWGLARRLHDAAGPLDPLAPVGVDIDPERPDLTGFDDLLGTPSFMPPEQISRRFGEIGPPSDVYALGATLYRLLARRNAFPGTPREMWRALLSGAPPTLDGGPPGLRPIVARCLALDPRGRYPDAAALAVEVRRWLDGEVNRARASELTADAMRLRPLARSLRAEAAHLEDEAHAVLGPLPPFAPVEQKAPGWSFEDRAAEKLREARLADVAYLQALRNALEIDPGLPEARQALNAHYRGQLVRAERRRDGDSAAEYAALLKAHDDAGNAEWLRGDGSLTLLTDPPGASVKLYRYVEQQRRLVRQFDRALPSTPFVEVPLAMGSWLLRIEAPGHHPVDYPVNIERTGHWHGIPPGGAAPHAIWLPPQGALGPGECYVPAGWFISGGDAEAPDGLARRPIWLDGYIIRRSPVTNAEYLDFIERLAAEGQLSQARAMHPRAEVGRRQEVPSALVERGPRRWSLGVAFGAPLKPDAPVVGVDWYCADRFAAAAGSGWRLPHEWEWEKAARGVDGRRYPWGDRFDPTFARVDGCRPGPNAIGPVAEMPFDTSPYGVRDLGGNSRDLCLNVYERKGPAAPDGRPAIERPRPTDQDFMIIRGGSYVSRPSFCLTATRFGLPPDRVLSGVGFRLARSIDARG
ncbi:MAG: SUMF1/EgtB/PvdO family nonheme iron enzyme [Myxococcales bacterium]|nr:SUMF1/EgtB/PvdO family nonheme iron enzyme [Myxococcales bacterium]